MAGVYGGGGVSVSGFEQGKTGGLTKQEKAVVKKLCLEGKTNQDIQAFINFGRLATVNFARIAQVKSDKSQKPCSDDFLASYKVFKSAYDARTGLNHFTDERLVRSREALLLAISIFNNPSLSFRAEAFSVLAISGWTYLAHQYCEENKLPLERKDGSAISLADFLKFSECPFSDGVRNNLKSMIKIRDIVSHRMLGPFEGSWLPLFQANCLNFEKTITGLFGARTSLASEASFALQLSGFDIGQVQNLAKSGLPSHIESINAELYSGLSEEEKANTEYQFGVVYTTVSTSKSKAAFKFIAPESAEGLEIQNVLVKHKPSSETHPYKPGDVVKMVQEKSGKPFSAHLHTQAWKSLEVRPSGEAKDPTKTKVEYCFYNPTFKQHCYSPAWVDLLVKKNLENSEGLA